MRISVRYLQLSKTIEFYIVDGKNYYSIHRQKKGYCEVLRNNFTIGELYTANYKFSGNAMYRSIIDIAEVKTINQFISEVCEILKTLDT